MKRSGLLIRKFELNPQRDQSGHNLALFNLLLYHFKKKWLNYWPPYRKKRYTKKYTRASRPDLRDWWKSTLGGRAGLR